MGSDKRVLQIIAPDYYSQVCGGTYMVLIEKLYKRRFFHVSKFDLDEWMDEARSASDIVLIEQSIPSIAICREILAGSNEETLMHPIVADSNPEALTYEFERHNYQINFTPVDNCGYLDCPLCVRPIEILKEPQLFYLGVSRYEERVISMNKNAGSAGKN